MIRKAVLAAALALSACGPKSVPPPQAPGPAIETPADAMPADLDVVVRLDLGRMRRTLGKSTMQALRARTKQTGADQRLLDDALAASDTVWIGIRPGLDPELTDNVIVLRGSFADLDPKRYDANPKWSGPVDLGAGWRVYERSKPPSRSSPARLYLRADDLMVLVSEAEIDSAERVIEQGVPDEALDPPEQGAISVAARLRPLALIVEDRSPMAAKLLARGEQMTASADLGPQGLKAELEFEFATEKDARDVADATGLLVAALAANDDLPPSLARSLHIEAVGARTVVRLVLSNEELAGLVLQAR